MKYDDASWHGGGEFPPDSPDEFGGTHIALMLKWCFLKGWAGDLHREDSPDDLERMLRGGISATDYLFTWCDGKFTDEDLNAEGNAFVLHYYERGPYFQDFEKNFGPMYMRPEHEHDFGRFSEIVEARHQAFLAAPTAADAGEPRNHAVRRPWWKLW